MFKRLASCVREYKKPTILTLIFIIGEVIIETFIPFITADLVNRVKAGVAMEELLKTGLFLVLMACLSLSCGGIAGFTCAKASAGFAKNLRADIFRRIQSFSFENIDKFSSTSLVTRMTTDVANVQMSYMMIIRTAVRSPLMFIFSVIMAYYMGGALATSFVIVIPLLIFGLFTVSRKAMPAFRAVFRKYDRLNESIEENVRAMRVVKGFSREEHEKQKFDAAAHDICNDFTKAERIVALNSPLMQICMNINMVFILYLGSRLIITNQGTTIDVGQISAMLTYGMSILMSLNMLSMIYVILTMSSESMKRIYEVLEEEPALTSPASAVTEVRDGSIEFTDVSFKYSAEAEKYALSDIDLRIESGMTVGILGGTGSSKTTLVSLIPRLYDVSEGAVKVGGRDVREYDLTTLRDAVAVVLQKNLLFSGTIKENLRWGNEHATDAELEEACRLAQADDFIRSFPDGYDTKIEQGGTNVSGGQKQRLCIARALLKKPKILILDDSTSAVDMKTDAFIRAGFKSFIPETTKIIIAQRVASVQDADLILVMDNGRISAMGKHDELLKTSEIYREVYDQQTGGKEDDHE
ncbi:MAG: ABC transporter ATP-binding protein [Clostridia bacterium]|nr:ABC transporter ATP-binding protein [Clostridia bacterium]MBQ8370205.1 ABC transporter ATP-binding protein [Clostridia bacterium]MBQ8512725.1 ABC transporter ATP-binding protein [Clostridia bacterium]